MAPEFDGLLSPPTWPEVERLVTERIESLKNKLAMPGVPHETSELYRGEIRALRWVLRVPEHLQAEFHALDAG